MNMYIVHPNTSTTPEQILVNQDVGDLVGDTGYICSMVLSANKGIYGSLISLFQLMVDPHWGVYMNCPGEPYPCLPYSGDRFRVGRQATYQLSADFGGQCTNNSDLGSWFSLPKNGMCQVDFHNCTWSVLNLVKTITMECLLLEQNMAQSCRQDRYVPFPHAVEVYRAAWLSNETEKGGCPDVSKSKR